MRLFHSALEKIWLGTVSFILISTLVALVLSISGLLTTSAIVALTIGAVTSCLIVWRVKLATASSLPKDTLVWQSAVAICFALFTLRAFLWLIFLKEDRIAVLSRNNLGDLPLHIQYIRFFSHGAPLWPANPIHAHSTIGYPFGIDYFNALLDVVGLPLWSTLIVTGIVCSLATGIALYRWGKAFGVAGFLFSGGAAGLTFFKTGQWIDFQQTMDWKSLPLALFVTQRGFLYALPAGLLLLVHWRGMQAALPSTRRFPFWLEWLVYASMPLFHLHTFLFLSAILGTLCLAGNERRHFLTLGLAAFLPATGLIWLLTDGFHASSQIAWLLGWMAPPGFSVAYWWENFGVMPLFLLALIAVLTWQRNRAALVWVVPAALLFLATFFIKFSPWEWDNTKLMMWCWLTILPFLWKALLATRSNVVPLTACVMLFFTGFLSLWAGLGRSEIGYEIATSSHVRSVALVVRDIPILEVFAAAPDYAHPLVFSGRRLALGYHGHMVGHGLSYESEKAAMDRLMSGSEDWTLAAAELGVHYLYWGPSEEKNWPASRKPWIESSPLVAAGEWGELYRLTSPESVPEDLAPSLETPRQKPMR